jgi:hypothetical protein
MNALKLFPISADDRRDYMHDREMIRMYQRFLDVNKLRLFSRQILSVGVINF